MRFTLDAVVLECADAAETRAGYLGLGCTAAGDLGLGAGVDTLLEVGTAGESTPPGRSIDRIVFGVDDLATAFGFLLSNGVEAAGDPYDGSAVVLGPDGLRIEIREADRPRAAAVGPDGLRLHHVCLLTTDYQGAEAFFAANFGMRKLYEFSKAGVSGFMFLADDGWDAGDHGFLLEIIGGPNFMTEQPAWDAHGPHYDHLCFSMDDVAAAYDRGCGAGLSPMSLPRHYPEYDLDIAWLYDRDGLHVELLEEMPVDDLRRALETGVVENQWVDDVIASLDMVPFKGRP